MSLQRKLQLLERRAREAPCPRCKNEAGPIVVFQFAAEPLDAAAHTACPVCGRSPDNIYLISISVAEPPARPGDLAAAPQAGDKANAAWTPRSSGATPSRRTA
jgi:hypothetical protein